jgi:hypothetical protein
VHLSMPQHFKLRAVRCNGTSPAFACCAQHIGIIMHGLVSVVGPHAQCPPDTGMRICLLQLRPPQTSNILEPTRTMNWPLTADVCLQPRLHLWQMSKAASLGGTPLFAMRLHRETGSVVLSEYADPDAAQVQKHLHPKRATQQACCGGT